MPPARAQLQAPEPDPVSQIIRARRVQRDWSLARLASLAELQSPAYVFHIENGTKTPSPAVARRIGTALGLDPELLAAWATSRGRADLKESLAAARRVQAWLDESSGAPAATSGTASAARTPSPTPDATANATNSIEVPVLPEGADPLDGDPFARAIETIRVDRALLPPLEANARLVGFRLSAHGARRIPESLRAGDCVVVLLGDDTAGPDTPCALRVGARVEIARRAGEMHAQHLPPPRSAPDSERTASRTPTLATGDIVGRVVLAIRRWL